MTVVLLTLLFAQCATAQTVPTFVQRNAATPQSPQSTVTVSYTAAQASGDLNVVVIGWHDATRQVQSVGDTLGNVYTKAVEPTVRSGVATQVIYYASNVVAAPAGGNAVTVKFTAAATFADVRIAAYRGVATASPVDVTAAATGSGAASDSGPVTTTNPNDLIVGANWVETVTTAAGAGFTNRIITSPNGNILEDRTVSTTGSYRATATASGSGVWIMQLVAFRAADSTSTPPSVTTLTPASGPVATSVTIAGANFGATRGTSTVTFNNVPATPTTWTPASIVVTVPTGATTGPVVVTVGAVASAGVTFTVTGTAPGPITFVQANSAVPQTPQSAVPVSYTRAQITGNLNVVVVGWSDATTQIQSVTDSQANTYVRAIGPTVNATGYSLALYYAVNIRAAAAGANAVTVAFVGAARFPDIRILEYSGIDSVTPLDAVVASQGSGTTSNSGSLTTTAATDLLVTATQVQTVTTAAGTGFTSRVITSPNGDLAADRVVSAVGTYTGTAPLSPTGAWVMLLVAFRGVGNSPPVPDTTAPTIPTGIAAGGVSPSQINVSWIASTDNVGVVQYNVFRDGVQVGSPPTTVYFDIGLTPGTSYTYTVSAQDLARNVSLPSASATGTTLAPDTSRPSVPTNLQVSGTTTTTVSLGWTAATDNVSVIGYRIYRDAVQIGSSGTTFYADAQLRPGTSYSYTVSAFDAAGNDSGQSPSVPATTVSGPAYPLKVSPNHRYLVDQNDRPFLITGDSPHAMIGNMSLAEADTYLADRAAAGFNTLWVMLMCNANEGCHSDGSTYDGIVPFTTPNDFAAPNEPFFARADAMIGLAAKHGIVVMFNAAETIGWLDIIKSNGVTKSRAFGQYLGTRYKAFDNIIWFHGNDFQTWSVAADDAAVRGIAEGIASVDTRHIQTVELDYPVSGSIDDPTWLPLISLDAAYTYFPTYAQVLKDYNRANLPVFMVEAHYELEGVSGEYGSPRVLRAQEYWSMLSGAAGHLYGNYYLWQVRPGWQQNLATPGAAQIGYLNALLLPRRWYDLVPDQNHTVVIAGYGTYDSTTLGINGSNDYVTAARTPDGAVVIAYVPRGQAITVDMSKLLGPTTARWYDPSNGTYVSIAGSPLSNIGTWRFTTPGTTSDGSTDWVLLLEATL